MRSFEIPAKQKDEVVLTSGGVYPELAASIAESIGIEVTDVELKRHPNGERYVRYDESVRGKDVFVVQSHKTANGYTVDEAVNEQLLMVKAASGASARSVTAVVPYLAYSRGDRKSRGREAVSAPLFIEFYEAAGATAMMGVDVHSPQTPEHFRRGPFDVLTAQPELRRAVRAYLGSATENCVIVAPDAGAMKSNNRHARELSKEEGRDIDVVFLGKERARDDSTKLTRPREISGVDGKVCLMFDDIIDGGKTMATAAETLKNSGATEIYIAATHPILSGKAAELLAGSAISAVFVTDTLPAGKAKTVMGGQLQIVPIGPLIGRAVYETVTGGSISKLFADQNHY